MVWFYFRYCQKRKNETSNTNRKLAKNKQELEKWVKKLNNEMTTAISEATKLINYKKPTKTKRIIELINKHTENLQKTSPSTHTREKHTRRKHSRLKLSKTIKSCRTKAWKEFCSNRGGTKVVLRYRLSWNNFSTNFL